MGGHGDRAGFAGELGLGEGLARDCVAPAVQAQSVGVLYWTESSTGADSLVLSEVGNAASPFPPGTPMPLGNRVDRFVWDATSQTLTFDRNIVVLRAFQADAGQPLRGNHDGGVIRFGGPRDEIRRGEDRHDESDGLEIQANTTGTVMIKTRERTRATARTSVTRAPSSMFT